MKLKYNFVINEVAGEYIALAVGSNKGFNGYMRINTTAKDILELLKDDIDRDSIVSKLCEMYPDAKISEVGRSVDETLEKLNSAGLLI